MRGGRCKSSGSLLQTRSLSRIEAWRELPRDTVLPTSRKIQSSRAGNRAMHPKLGDQELRFTKIGDFAIADFFAAALEQNELRNFVGGLIQYFNMPARQDKRRKWRRCSRKTTIEKKFFLLFSV